MDKYVDCQECNGTGKKETDLYIKHCLICDGTGTDSRIIKTDIGTIGVSEFVKRQTRESRFSYYDGEWTNILELIKENIDTQKPKYRPDVIGIIIPPEKFFSSIVEMKEGDTLVGKFTARQDGEEPRTQIGVVDGKKIPAKFVEIILYSKEALAEGNENSLNVDWEIISINASPTEDEDIPLRPMTLVSNHFELDGGTATGMSEREFIVALKKSVEFWKDKGLVADGS